MQNNAVHTGGCLCGAIRFEAKPPAGNPHTCSCKMCQRHSGSLSTVWVEFPKDAVNWINGEPATWRSSNASSRAYCPTCGSTLGAIDDDPVVALLLGTFDDTNREDLIPASHSYNSGLPDWWHLEVNDADT